MKTKNITTGKLNEFTSFYGEVKFYNEQSNEIYEALREDATEMLNSPEMWVAQFNAKGKSYAIMADGSLTSDGNYVVSEII